MKVSSQLAFAHDYSREFGGERRLHRHYTVLIDNEPQVSLAIKWDYQRPQVYMIDTCKQDSNGYIFIDCGSRKEAHKWIEDNYNRLYC